VVYIATAVSIATVMVTEDQ